MFDFLKRKKKADAVGAPKPLPSASLKQSLLSLEQRLMFDAAAAATAAEVKSEQVAQDQAEAAVSAEPSADGPTAEQGDSQEFLQAIASYTPGESTTEVAFVDPTVPDYQSLIAGMGPNVEVVMLDATRDGMEQIAESLAGRSGIDAIHLISHGNSGELQLGAGTLNTESMSGKYANELSTIQQSLSEQADILVYGCDFAEGERGQTAVIRLAELTGADVQASTDETGHISLGGDWEFEVRTGTIETSLAISDDAQMNWAGILGTETVRDTFSAESYSNNNGTQSWSTSWSETDASGGGASGGDVRVNSSQLRIDTDTIGNAVSRGVNLSGATGATLTFDYTNTLTGADRIEIRVSADGGANYQTLTSGIFSNAANTGSGSASFDLSGNMSANTRIQFIVTGTGGGDRLLVDNVQVSYDTGMASSAPTISNLSGDSISYTEGDGAVVIDQGANALVSDSDSANFDAGTLTVSIPSGAEPTEDVLGIRNQGTGAGQIGVSGSNVTYGGVTIGTFSGGAGGNHLVMTFNSNATPTAVTALAKNITYEDINTDSPIEGGLTIRFVLTDGDGGTSADYDVSAYVSGVNDAPTDLTLSANTVAENAANGTVVGTAVGTDVDTGDTKTYSLTDTAGGRFAINSSTGAITVANSSLLNYEAATSHSVTVRVTDSGGLTYDETFTINLTNANEAPTGADATVTINEDTSHTLTTANFGFSDVDTGDSLSAVRIDTLPSAGTLTLSGVAVTAGQVISVVNITAGNLVFTPAADANGTGYASFTFSVRDSNSAYDTAPNTFTVDVTAVNDAPIRTSGTVSNLTLSEDVGLASLGLGGVTYSPAGGADESGQTLTYAVTAIPSASVGDVFLADGTTQVTVGSYTLADIQGMQFKPAANASGVTAFQFNVYDSGGTANGGANTISQFILITVTAVNDAPTITNLSGDSVSYTEGAGAIVIEQGGNALVADVDSTNLDTGTLTVSIPSGGDGTEDVLSIRNQGTGAGQIGVSGANVTYQGVTIGTFTGGSSGANLVITLNSNATPTAVTALVKNITYENTDTNAPTTGARTVRFTLADGDGGTSANYDTAVTVTPVNDAPMITPVSPDVTFVEGGLPQVFDATGTIVDVDSANLDGGVMTVSISANGTPDDRLIVGNFGTGPGQVGLSGSNVTYGGIVVGTVSGGTSGSDLLVITFNTSATPTAVQEVYRSIQFNNVSDNPSTATRTLTIGLTDGDGGTATPQNKLVYVQGTNDAPVMTFGEGDKNFTEGALAVMIDALPNVSDLDSTNFDTGTLTITISANPSVDDRVELLNAGMGAGQIGVSGTNVYYGGTLIGTQAGGIGAAPFVVTFNANADASIVGEVMANIRFWVAGDAPATATRTVEAVLTDGDGGTSLTASKQITVTAVNDATVVTGGTSGTGTEDTVLTGTLTATDAEGLSDGSVFTVSTNATNGTASIDPATGLWSYTPTADYNGSDRFTVTITDDAGNPSTQVITLTVTPVNDALTDLALSANTVTENASNGTVVGTVTGTDVDTGDTKSYSLTDTAGGRFAINSSTGQITVADGSLLNYETATSHSVTVRVSDSGGLTYDETFTINLTNVNETPTAVTLSSCTVAENAANGTVVGTASTTDVDAGDLHTYQLMSNAGGRFAIDSNTGVITVADGSLLNYEAATSHAVTIRTTDAGGLTHDQVLSIGVTDVSEATTTTTVPGPLLPGTPPPTTGVPMPPSTSGPADSGPVDGPTSGHAPTPAVPPLDAVRSVSPPIAPRVSLSAIPALGPGHIREGEKPVVLDDERDLVAWTVVEPVLNLLHEAADQLRMLAQSPEIPVKLSEFIVKELDAMTESLEQAMEGQQDEATLVAATAASVSIVLSTGYVVWAIRGGWLLASLLATMPAWRSFDPLPVLVRAKEDRERGGKHDDRREDERIEHLFGSEGGRAA